MFRKSQITTFLRHWVAGLTSNKLGKQGLVTADMLLIKIGFPNVIFRSLLYDHRSFVLWTCS